MGKDGRTIIFKLIMPSVDKEIYLFFLRCLGKELYRIIKKLLIYIFAKLYVGNKTILTFNSLLRQINSRKIKQNTLVKDKFHVYFFIHVYKKILLIFYFFGVVKK